MKSRRNFVKKFTAGLTVPILPYKSFNTIENYSLSRSPEQFWKAVRASFPLQKSRVYFNNGTFGPSPYPVLETINEQLKDFNTRGEYGSTKKTRKKIAEYVKVKPEEISLTHNTTEGINIVTWGLDLKKGDEVIISKQEHVGNALPWLNRAKLHGIVLKPFEPGKTAEANLAIIESMITAKTRVIAIPHITCTTGLVLPIKQICSLARNKNIFTAIDGAHGSGTFDLDLKELGCDTYATSCHKWMLGPNGTGFLYIKEEHLDRVQAYWVGGYTDTGWDLYATPPTINGYVPTAHRYDYGSQNAAVYAGVDSAIDFMMNIGQKNIEARVKELASYLQNSLLELDSKVEMLTPTENESRISMTGFRLKNMDYLEFNKYASQNDFRIRVVPESGLNSIRISTHIYNNKEEIDRFVDLVKNT